MDEEYAKQVEKEQGMQISHLDGDVKVELLTEDMSSTENTNNDLLLAQMMQLEFDKEYDGFVKTKEKVFNQNSNVKISFEESTAHFSPYEREEESSDSSQNDDDFDYDLWYMMQKMFKECNLIHADLSEYNMLWHEDKLWVIDVSQSVEPTHPRALEFLVRDCNNVVTFFEKAGVPCVMSVDKLFNHVSGMEVSGEREDFLNQIRDYEQNEELLTHGMAENMKNFDYFFDLAKKENTLESHDDDEAAKEGST
eukprot:Seg539.2 transcript_id=Seg539.2/GoldUCD/mRNA.D3Y31 product="Serine/threonine-protein kinase RIO3" protein_id=Seg539.2/GoldUCD/D3Y31